MAEAREANDSATPVMASAKHSGGEKEEDSDEHTLSSSNGENGMADKENRLLFEM